MEVGEEGDYIPIAIHCHHQNDSCIKMGSDDSHFNVSVGSDGQTAETGGVYIGYGGFGRVLTCLLQNNRAGVHRKLPLSKPRDPKQQTLVVSI